jgi:hypothetical protein
MGIEQAGIARPANEVGGFLLRRQFGEAREQLAELVRRLELGEDRLGAYAGAGQLILLVDERSRRA